VNWGKIRDNWTLGWLLISVTVFLPTAYWTPLGIPALLFLTGVPLLYHLRDVPKVWPMAALSSAVVLFAFLRSDFVGNLLHGMGVATAYTHANHYYVALIFILIMGWAVVLGARDLDDERAWRLSRWFLWLMLVLTGLLMLEGLSGGGLHYWMNIHIFNSTRPGRAIVKVSNSNCTLLFMFWPVSLFAMARQWPQTVGAMAVTICVVAFVTDTNAHIIALAASAAVFFATKYWPRAWSLRGLTPERVLAVGAAAFILLFPVLIIGLMRSGLAQKIHDHAPESWAQRINIWTFAVSRSLEKPVWGWGYESSRHFMPTIPDHPHNMALQAWMELGIIGLVLLAAFWAVLFWGMGTRDDFVAVEEDKGDLRDLYEASAYVRTWTEAQRVRPYLTAMATAYFIINTVSYGLWRSWVFCIGIFAVAMMFAAVRGARHEIKLRI